MQICLCYSLFACFHFFNYPANTDLSYAQILVWNVPIQHWSCLSLFQAFGVKTIFQKYVLNIFYAPLLGLFWKTDWDRKDKKNTICFSIHQLYSFLNLFLQWQWWTRFRVVHRHDTKRDKCYQPTNLCSEKVKLKKSQKPFLLQSHLKTWFVLFCTLPASG